MTLKVKITAVGRGAGIELPRELLDKLGVAKGDVLHVSEVPDGLKLTPRDPQFEDQMKIVDSVMREDREVLKRLARD
jgi:putative addiction module antidote